MESIRKWKSTLCICMICVMASCNTATSKTTDVGLESRVRAGDGVLDKLTSQLAGLTNASSIKIALLLDTSNSMDGLIEQAKSQLWKIVLQLSKAKKDGMNATLQMALYEYGNDGLSSDDQYIRLVTPFTTDLDKISEELFALRTFGGSEYCGAVLAKSMTDLEWAKQTEGLQVIFIAGNEPFDQGSTNYENVCHNATETDIIVNTIYCGDYESGISTFWKKGADITEGFYGTIDMDQTTVYVETPYDEEIQKLNEQLNATYLTYGSQGLTYCTNMTTQDANATTYGSANMVDRVSVKCSHVYFNPTWDLVDAVKDSSFKVSSVKKEELPKEMQEMTYSQQTKYVESKSLERSEIQLKVRDLSLKRDEYILLKQKEMGLETTGLDYAIINAIMQQAMAQNFTFDC